MQGRAKFMVTSAQKQLLSFYSYTSLLFFSLTLSPFFLFLIPSAHPVTLLKVKTLPRASINPPTYTIFVTTNKPRCWLNSTKKKEKNFLFVINLRLRNQKITTILIFFRNILLKFVYMKKWLNFNSLFSCWNLKV